MLAVRIAVGLLLFAGPLTAQHAIPSGASELRVALKKLGVLGSALYVAAHPDDENTAVISALSKGRFIRTAYLSMTRGEGGQNLIGPEQGDLLGILRTQELLSARRIDGGGQFFTRAIDFGYSKTPEETMRIWGREGTIGDIVWVIRSFRPDVIITRFADSLGTHGNHTSSAILARDAFLAAGDPTRFPEQLKFVSPWQPKRIVFNIFRFGSSGMDPTPESVALDVGSFSPLLGESFTEISGRSRSMHKSQGFGAAENRGTNLQYFAPTAGVAATRDLFDGIDVGWSRIPGGEEAGQIIEGAYRSFDPERPSAIVPSLMKAYKVLVSLESDDPWIPVKQTELRDVILGCAGFHAEAVAGSSSASPGDSVQLNISFLNRSDVGISVKSVRLPFSARDSSVAQPLKNNSPFRMRPRIAVPLNAPYSQPYWLEDDPLAGSYVVANQALRGTPENRPLILGVSIEVFGTAFDLEVPIRYKWVDRVQGELSRPFVVVPPVAVNLTEEIVVFAGELEKEIRVVVLGRSGTARGSVRLEAPAGWTVTPARVPFGFGEQGGESSAIFTVKATTAAATGDYRAVVEMEGAEYSLGMVDLNYPHIDPQMYFPPAAGKLIRVPMKPGRGNIGYIAGSGDELPTAMRQLGYSVTFVGDEDLESSDLSRYDAIVAGVRAYNTRPKLKVHHQRLMEYVRNGGRYVVQYVTRESGKSENLGPYPFEVSRDRVTVEDAPVEFVLPHHPVLNMPNKITQEDFTGWVQERGLYFADHWDPRYEAVLACADPGEEPKQGGLLVAKYGKGTFIYAAYAFFRQIPAGVPGAYRLLVNLLEH